MGTIAWQYGQVGDWNLTRLGRGAARTSASKFEESRTTSLEALLSGELGVVGEEVAPPPPHAAARRAATRAVVALRLTSRPPRPRDEVTTKRDHGRAGIDSAARPGVASPSC
jgi:hypothetical protein